MKIAFTTLGCPDWSFERILQEARAMGCASVEIRGLEGEMQADKIGRFLPEKRGENQGASKGVWVVAVRFWHFGFLPRRFQRRSHA